MRACIVPGCVSNSGRVNTISFPFPKANSIRNQWLAAINLNGKPIKTFWRVCSRHFEPQCYGTSLHHLNENAVPTLNMSSETNVSIAKGLTETPTIEWKIAKASYKRHINKLERQVKKLQKTSQKRLLRINALDKKAYRLQKNNSKINQKMTELLQTGETEKEFIIKLKNGQSNEIIEKSNMPDSAVKEYSQELRKFAVTLYNISPKAYSFVHKALDTLPHPNSILEWNNTTMNCNSLNKP